MIVLYDKIFVFVQQPDSGRKQLEQLVPQLQEQLQVNFVQQTHLLQTDRSKSSPALQQLQIQQQQLISQLQLVQQRLIMVSAAVGKCVSQRRYSPLCLQTSLRTCAGNAAHRVLKVLKCNAPIQF